MRVIIAVLLMGCATGGVVQPPRATDKDVRIIERVVESVNPTWWQRSPWYDLFHDLTTPARVVISGAWACPQDAGTIDDPKPGQQFYCPGGWRAPGHRQ